MITIYSLILFHLLCVHFMKHIKNLLAVHRSMLYRLICTLINRLRIFEFRVAFMEFLEMRVIVNLFFHVVSVVVMMTVMTVMSVRSNSPQSNENSNSN